MSNALNLHFTNDLLTIHQLSISRKVNLKTRRNLASFAISFSYKKHKLTPGNAFKTQHWNHGCQISINLNNFP